MSFLVIAATYTESQFKGGALKGETFLEQQFWLYIYSSAIACLVHVMSDTSYGLVKLSIDLQGMEMEWMYKIDTCCAILFLLS